MTAPNMTASGTTTPGTTAALTPAALLAHWQGHRRLTRRTLGAFPEAELFTFTPAPPMRPFGPMMLEVLELLEPTLTAVAGGGWKTALPQKYAHVASKKALLAAWDEADGVLETLWATIPPERFLHVESMFGLPAQPLAGYLLYGVDNEVHHRAQGYVYLRLLGIEPPAFYER